MKNNYKKYVTNILNIKPSQTHDFNNNIVLKMQYALLSQFSSDYLLFK